MKNNTTSSSSTASNTTPHKSQESTEPLDGASCSVSSLLAAKDKVLEALKHQQELPYQRLLTGSPEEQEAARLDMIDRALNIKSAIKDYFAQSTN